MTEHYTLTPHRENPDVEWVEVGGANVGSVRQLKPSGKWRGISAGYGEFGDEFTADLDTKEAAIIELIKLYGRHYWRQYRHVGALLKELTGSEAMAPKRK